MTSKTDNIVELIDQVNSHKSEDIVFLMDLVGLDASSQLSGMDLRETNFFGQDLNGFDLSEANLESANLEGTNLHDANLSGANLENANLSGANLEKANFSGANLKNTILRNANLTKANLTNTNIVDASPEGAYIDDIVVERVVIDALLSKGCRLRDVSTKQSPVRKRSKGKGGLRTRMSRIGRKKIKTSARIDTLIGQNTVITGDLMFTGGLHVDGKIFGNVIAYEGSDGEELVILSESGHIEGDVMSPNMLLDGEIIGTVFSSKHIELAPKARIRGSVHYNNLEMAIGAEVDGGLHHKKSESSDDSQDKADSDKTDKTSFLATE